MKKSVFIIFFLYSLVMSAQAPQIINYQGIARSSSGNIITTGSIGLRFKIYQASSTGPLVYQEVHTATPNSVGIFTASIGGGTPIGALFNTLNWALGPYFLEVAIDPSGGSSYSVVGISQLVAVPYALYAEKAGSGATLPTGTLTGQTLSWNNISGAWNVSSNLQNDNNHVAIGENLTTNNKLLVYSKSITDSAAIFAYHTTATGNAAAVRGLAVGAATNSGTLDLNPIMGGHFIGYNILNNGSAVGVLGQGATPGGDAVGVIAVGSSSSTSTGRSVGLYATAKGSIPANDYAAIFENGKVLINDSILVGTSGNVGDVLTRGANGRTFWAPGLGTPIWSKPTSSTVVLANNNDNVGIGTTIPNSKLEVQSNTPNQTLLVANNYAVSSGFAHGIKGISSNPNSVSAGVYGEHNGNGFGLYGINNNSLTSIGTGVYGLSVGTSSTNIGVRGDGNAGGNAIGVQGIAFGTGNSVYGLKLNTSSAGSAGKFEILSINNPSDALIGLTAGSGAAIHAICGPTPSSSVALFVDNGHIKVSGNMITTITGSVNGGFSPLNGATCSNCNDVRGTVSFSTGVTGFGAGNFADATVTFIKPYSMIPIVNITPLVDLQDLLYMVSNVTTTGFTIRVYRSSNRSVPISVPNSLFKFNYIVIE